MKASKEQPWRRRNEKRVQSHWTNRSVASRHAELVQFQPCGQTALALPGLGHGGVTGEREGTEVIVSQGHTVLEQFLCRYKHDFLRHWLVHTSPRSNRTECICLLCLMQGKLLTYVLFMKCPNVVCTAGRGGGIDCLSRDPNSKFEWLRTQFIDAWEEMT